MDMAVSTGPCDYALTPGRGRHRVIGIGAVVLATFVAVFGFSDSRKVTARSPASFWSPSTRCAPTICARTATRDTSSI
jgi:hypothetical protein